MPPKYKKSFQYFSVIVPTEYPVASSKEKSVPHPAGRQDASYLRFGDTPKMGTDIKKAEPGQALRKMVEGKPKWERKGNEADTSLHLSFAPDNILLRDNAGVSVPAKFDAGESFNKNIGWVDHANGHRVTTTHGDKVEVITGNYKLVVLGREGDPAKSTGFDMSGGHTMNWAKTPGCIRTITGKNGTFKVTHVTDKGLEYTVFEGTDTDHIVGGSTSISLMGGTNHLVADKTKTGAMALVVDKAWSKKIIDADYGATIVDVDAGAPMRANLWDFDEDDDLLSTKDVVEAFPDSHAAVIGLSKAEKVVECRSAKEFHEWVSVDKHEEIIHAATEMNNKVVVATGQIVEDWTALSYTESFSGSRKNTTTGPWETEHHFVGNKLDLVVAGFWEETFFGANKTTIEGHALNVNIALAGLFLDIYMGTKIEREPVMIDFDETRLSMGILKLERRAAGVIAQAAMGLRLEGMRIHL